MAYKLAVAARQQCKADRGVHQRVSGKVTWTRVCNEGAMSLLCGVRLDGLPSVMGQTVGLKRRSHMTGASWPTWLTVRTRSAAMMPPFKMLKAGPGVAAQSGNFQDNTSYLQHRQERACMPRLESCAEYSPNVPPERGLGCHNQAFCHGIQLDVKTTKSGCSQRPLLARPEQRAQAASALPATHSPGQGSSIDPGSPQQAFSQARAARSS